MKTLIGFVLFGVGLMIGVKYHKEINSSFVAGLNK